MGQNNLEIITLFLSSCILLTLACVGGYRLGLKNQGIESKKISSIVPSSIFGLLALIVSFSFSMSVGRYEERRHLAIDEANSITTAYIRARLLNPVPGIDIKGLYKDYLDSRIAFYENDLDPKEFEKSKTIERKLVQHFLEVVKNDRTVIESVYINALNPMFDMANNRNFALFKTLPKAIYYVTLFIAIVAFGTLNYDRGSKREVSHWSIVIYVMLFTLVFTLVYDIDHARSGLIRISQDAMIAARSIFL